MFTLLLACARLGDLLQGGFITWPGLVVADRFDFPVGNGEARGYYDAQPFGKNRHLGADWNGKGGGNTDYGLPVASSADGVVVEALDRGGGWGNVVRVVHRLPGGELVETLYAHLATVAVNEGMLAPRGALLGTIGDAGGQYYAHLHFEVRDRPGAPLGGGYGTPDGHVDPTAFIGAHRGASPPNVRRAAHR